MKLILFVVAFLGTQIQCLPVILEALKVGVNLAGVGTNNSDVVNTNTSYSVRDGNIVIRSDIRIDADYVLKVSNYKIGQYQIPPQSKCMNEIKSFAKKLAACLAPIIDSNANVIVQITGQADGIKCSKKAKYHGQLDIPKFKCFSLVTNRDYYKSFYPQVMLENEDYARLRAYDAYLILSQNIRLENTEYLLRSNVTNAKGQSNRFVVVEIFIPDAFKNKTEKYNKLQKKIFNVLVNAQSDLRPEK